MSSKPPAWPKFLFATAVCVVLVSASAFLAYGMLRDRLDRQTADFSAARDRYDKRIAELEQKKIVERTVSEAVSVPSVRDNCTSLPFRVCIPQVVMESRQISRTERVEDPVVRAELDRQRAELAALIQQAQTTAEQGQRLEALLSRVGMRQALSALLVFAALFIIMSKQYGPESEKWAFGTIGTLLGYWLK